MTEVIKASEARVAGKGEKYEDRETGEFVYVFAVTNDEVAYAPEGKSSEGRLSQQDFLSKFKFTGFAV